MRGRGLDANPPSQYSGFYNFFFFWVPKPRDPQTAILDLFLLDNAACSGQLWSGVM